MTYKLPIPNLIKASWPIRVTAGAAILLLLIGGTFGAMQLSKPHKTTHAQNNPQKTADPATGNTLAASTQAVTPTPTVSPEAAHIAPANAKAVSSQVSAAMPKVNIPVVQVLPPPAASPSPTNSPNPANTPTPVSGQYDPAVTAWFYNYAQTTFNGIYNQFLDMGTQAENNNIAGIQHDCGIEHDDAYTLQYSMPDVPQESMNQELNNYSNALMSNSENCQSGINNGDAEETVNAIYGMRDAILGLIALEQRMVPTN